MSRNAVTVEQLCLACRHVDDLLRTGMSENLAIRNLEQFANMYAKYRALGHVSPDHVDQYDTWSEAALAWRNDNPKAKPGTNLRVEHGTPRRQFARRILTAFQEGFLSKDWLDEFCDRKWRVAIITHEEDRGLIRSGYFDDPVARWADLQMVVLDKKSGLTAAAGVEDAFGQTKPYEPDLTRLDK